VRLNAGTDGASPLEFSENNTVKWRVFAHGTNDAYQIYDADWSAGVSLSQNSTSWSGLSDIRLKSNIIEETNFLDRINSIHPVTYNFNNSPNRELGVIAQDIMTDFPELIQTVHHVDGNEYYAVTYDRLGAIAIGGIKELHQLQIDQQAQIDAIRDGLTMLNPESITTNTASSATSSATIAFDHQGNLINPDDNLTAQAQASTQTDSSFFDRFISLIVKNLTALNITSRSITTQELVSPLVDADQITTNTLTTNLIKPQSDSDLILSLNNQSATTPAQLLITDSQDNTVTSIDSSGNATFSGELVANSAKFDSLEVGNLKANQIEGLTDTLSQIKSASEAAKLFLDRLTAKHSAQDESLNATAQQLVSTSSSQLLSTLEDNFTLDSDGTHLALTGLSSDYAYFSDYLAVEGTLMTNDLYVENNLITSSISSPLDAEDQTLYLQPTGTGAINLLAGLLILDESGTVSLNGNLIVTGTLESGSATISGTLDLRATNLDNSDEATHSGFGQLLSIYNEQGEQVAGVDASGSAQFNNLTTRQIIIAASQNSTPSANQASTSSNTTIGTATIPAGELTTYIENNNISDTTLIYLTPISDTKNQVLYVKNKYSCPVDAPLSCQPFFTVAINQPTTQDIQFNYWLIQVQ
jgi:hypothetical protein